MFWRVLFHFTMTLITCGLWLVWLLIKFLLWNTPKKRGYYYG